MLNILQFIFVGLRLDETTEWRWAVSICVHFNIVYVIFHTPSTPCTKNAMIVLLASLYF